MAGGSPVTEASRRRVNGRHTGSDKPLTPGLGAASPSIGEPPGGLCSAGKRNGRGPMNPFGKKTSNDVFDLLSEIHLQLEVFDNKTLKWRDKIEGRLSRMEGTLDRVEYVISRRKT